MNDWNQWEHQLTGWVPRRPSQKVKRRLFPSAPTAKSEWPGALSWQWLAVASSFVLLAVIVLSQSNLGPVHASASRTSHLLAGLSLSNGNHSSYSLPNRHSRQNA